MKFSLYSALLVWLMTIFHSKRVTADVSTKKLPLAEEFYYGNFPPDFKFGFATASYQVEGAWNKAGKGANIWDNFTHANADRISDRSNGDIACDSYHKYKEDIKLVKFMKGDFYRFSVSWARILPNGTLAGGVNQAGLNYYNALIEELQAHGIEPMITLYHWDLPQPLEDIGGFLNDDFHKYFGDYARLMYSNFGDRVKLWITFNEPFLQCVSGYGNGQYAPGLAYPATGAYNCGHNHLKAHAVAYHIYQNEFKPTQGGKVGITLNSRWYEPQVSGNPDHEEAAETILQFEYGWFAHPVVFGDYPPRMRQLIDAKSKREGRNSSRLPVFNEHWRQQLKGSFDFLGLNHYTTSLVYPEESNEPGWDGDKNKPNTGSGMGNFRLRLVKNGTMGLSQASKLDQRHLRESAGVRHGEWME